MAQTKPKSPEPSVPKPKGPTNLQLAEALRRLVNHQVKTEEDRDAFFALLEGKG